MTSDADPVTMRILTVRQPWALHIIQSGKDVENRPKNIAGAYRGLVAIHAGKKADERAMFDLPRLPPNGIPQVLYYGEIIGVAELVDVHRDSDCFEESIHNAIHLYYTDRAAFDALPIVNESAGGIISRAKMCSSWAQPDQHHLVFKDPRPLTKPIPYQGALGLRILPEDVTRKVLERVTNL